MDLQEFLSEAITQVVNGVADAQQKTAGSSAKVNPEFLKRGGEPDMGFTPTTEGMASVLRFDIALTTTEGTDTKGGIGVATGIFNLGSAGASSAENSTVSRVQFNVPVVLPNA